MAVEIKTDVVSGHCRITDYCYPSAPDITCTWKPETGIMLPLGNAFPCIYSNPGVLLNTYLAMCEGGLKETADQVLRTKKRSKVTLNYVWESVGKFSRRTVRRLRDCDPYTRALDKLRTELNMDDRLTPISLREASERVRQGSSPGLPFITMKPCPRTGEIIAKHFDDFEQMWDEMVRDSWISLPDTVALRVGRICAPTENVIREAWDMPIIVILQEARFALPIIDSLTSQRSCRNAGYGCEIQKGGMMWIHTQMQKLANQYGPGKILILDYNEFLSSVPAWLIRDIFSTITEKFDMSEEDTIKFGRCLNYFINTPIRISDGRRFKKAHGIPLGSMFTDIIGTLVNMIVNWTCSEVVFGSLPLWDIYFGKQAVIVMRDTTSIGIAVYAKAMQDFFGMEINTEKTYYTSDSNRLRFLDYYNQSGDPCMESIDILAALLYPSLNKHNSWEFCIRHALNCLLKSCGMNKDVFEACASVYRMAVSHGANTEEGIELFKKLQKSQRYLTVIGAQPVNINAEYFTNIKLWKPIYNCDKYQHEVDLVR